MASVAEQIRTARKARGLNQTQLADQVGLSVTTVSRLESGFLPRADRLAHIARALDLSIDDLFTQAAS